MAEVCLGFILVASGLSVWRLGWAACFEIPDI
jgi:hypothetical protein